MGTANPDGDGNGHAVGVTLEGGAIGTQLRYLWSASPCTYGIFDILFVHFTRISDHFVRVSQPQSPIPPPAPSPPAVGCTLYAVPMCIWCRF